MFNFRDKKINIVKNLWIFLLISVVIILAGLVDTFWVRGLNLGVEFSGGASIDVTVNDVSNLKEKEFENLVKDWLKGDRDETDGVDSKVFDVDGNVQKSGSGLSTFSFRIGTTMTHDGVEFDLNEMVQTTEGEQTRLVAENEEIKDELKEFLDAYLTKTYGKGSVEVEPHVIGNDVKNYTVKNAFIAVAVAVVVILVYIAIRFTLLAGVSAIIALLHDVLIMVAFTCIFQIPVNMTFIAAIITIVGYSINATIVVFDRIRELQVLPSNLEKTDKEIADEAIKSTLSRSIITTLTTLVMIVVLAIFGSAAIREFAFPIIFGLLAGLYSSVLLSAPIWVALRKLFGIANKKPAKKIKRIKEQANA